MQRGFWIGAVSGLLVGGVVATLLHNPGTIEDNLAKVEAKLAEVK